MIKSWQIKDSLANYIALSKQRRANSRAGTEELVLTDEIPSVEMVGRFGSRTLVFSDPNRNKSMRERSQTSTSRTCVVWGRSLRSRARMVSGELWGKDQLMP